MPPTVSESLGSVLCQAAGQVSPVCLLDAQESFYMCACVCLIDRSTLGCYIDIISNLLCPLAYDWPSFILKSR